MSQSQDNKPLNVGIWLNMPEPKVGGGFNYALDIILEIDRFDFNPLLNFIFLSFPPYNEPYIRYVSRKKIFRVRTADVVPTQNPNLLQRVFNRLRRDLKLDNSIKLASDPNSNESKWKSLKDENIHLIFYPVQHQVLFEDYPFVSNNWDLGHLSTFAFPELASQYEFDSRDKWYRSVFSKGFAFFAESQQGKAELVQYLNIFPEKIKILPHFFNSESVNRDSSKDDDFLKKHNLVAGRFLFYPAQFWAHKNHYNLILGFDHYLRDNSETVNDIKLIFTGSDQGNLNYIVSIISELRLQDRINYLGFVSRDEISILYRNALGLVFPSFLGPSNLPLIEAMYHECPVLCSNLIGHQELCADAAIYFAPDSSEEVAKAINQICDPVLRSALLSRTKLRVASGIYSGHIAMEALEKSFLEIRHLRMAWG